MFGIKILARRIAFCGFSLLSAVSFSQQPSPTSAFKFEAPPVEMPGLPPPVKDKVDTEQPLARSRSLPTEPFPVTPPVEQSKTAAPAVTTAPQANPVGSKTLPEQGRDTGKLTSATESEIPNDLPRLSKDEIAARSQSAGNAMGAYYLANNPRTVILDFPNPYLQGKMFGRVVLFIEREGTSKSRLMTVAEVNKWLQATQQQVSSLTMGNNIRASEFSRFFNTARFQGESLTVDEKRLYDWMLAKAFIKEEALGITATDPEVIFISIPQVGNANCKDCAISERVRKIVLEHELAHARFATDMAYQHYTLWFWTEGISQATRKKFTEFLHKRGYESSLPELMANEMQAFLLHTPDKDIFSASHLGISEAELVDLRSQFQAGLFPKSPAPVDKAYRLE